MVDKPATKLPIEIIPSVEGGVSAIASANAPFLYFDGAANFGYLGGIANITLEAVRHISLDGTNVSRDRVMVAHLRMSLSALMSLKAAITGIENLISDPPEKTVN